MLLGKLATLLPFGSVAWRVHALNGLFAALTCVLVYLIARRLMPEPGIRALPAYLAALGLGVSETFWSQALIADVYPLHGLLFFALLYLAIVQQGAHNIRPSRNGSAHAADGAVAGSWLLESLAVVAAVRARAAATVAARVSPTSGTGCRG